MSNPADYIIDIALAHVKQFFEELKPQYSPPVPEIHLVTYASCSNPEHPIHIELILDKIALIGTLDEKEQLHIDVPASMEHSLNKKFEAKNLPARAVVDTNENLKKTYGVDYIPPDQALNGLFTNYLELDLDPDPLAGYALVILVDTGPHSSQLSMVGGTARPAQQPTHTKSSTEDTSDLTTGMYL